MSERWRPIVGRESEYEVSDLGRVRSIARVKRYERRDQYSGRILTITRNHPGRVLRPGASKSGHLSVSLGRGQSAPVHQLVLTAFAGPCPCGMEALHRDGVPSNNRLNNLRWGSRSENLLDAVKHGAKAVGQDHYRAKLTNAEVMRIRALFSTMSFAAIARRYGVAESTVRQISSGRTWKAIV